MNHVNVSENRLAAEDSPYLLQHKTNPVDWYSWGKEAFEKSVKENKPIFLSIGYSTCHWCHVMADESFEDPATAKLMNELFVNIKVDREERPDIDDIYIEAVHVMTGHAGWPLSVFLTPDLKPFFGGTYFPKEKSQGRTSFQEILKAVSKFYSENKEDIFAKANKLVLSLKEASTSLSLLKMEKILVAKEGQNEQSVTTERICESLQHAYLALLSQLERSFDSVNGGLGSAPKFPEPSKLETLLFSDSLIHVNHALFTLKKIHCGGIVDHIEGGISRYSVDSFWHVPHFEKMLYDNAQILSLYSAGFFLCKEQEMTRSFESMLRKTYEYLIHNLFNKKEGLFFCAQNADSEGEEGFYYTINFKEFEDYFLGFAELKDFARQYFSLTEEGQLDGKNVLTIPYSLDSFCKEKNISFTEMTSLLEQSKNIFKKIRAEKEKPSVDTKMLLSWNSLLVTGLLHAAIALNDVNIYENSLNLLSQILAKFKNKDMYLHIFSQKNHKEKLHFSEDLGYLLEACVEVLLVTGCFDLVQEIKNIIFSIHKYFVDPSEGILFSSPKGEHLFQRSIKIEDNVLYSAHSAIFNSLTKLKYFLVLQEKSADFTVNDSKMLEALLLIVTGQAGSFADRVPIATAKFLNGTQFYNECALLKIHSVPSVKILNEAKKFCFEKNKQRTILCTTLNKQFNCSHLVNYASSSAAESQVNYIFCDKNGCQLKKDHLNEIFED